MFVISDFCRQIAEAEKGMREPEMKVGNLSAKRDFTDVRDVVRAYRMIAEKGIPGEVYNVGSGTTWSAQEILDKLTALSDKRIPVKQDPSRMRPSDTPVVCCDHSKLTKETGWQPEKTIDTIVAEVLEYYRSAE